MINVAINGFGRIGRLAFRIGLLKHVTDLRFVAINTSGSMEVDGWAHLVNYDTAYRKFPIEITSERVKPAKEATDEDPLIGYLFVKDFGLEVPVLAQKDPEKIPWGKYDVDVVIESTGRFTDAEGAKKHARAGAKRVVISAPAKGENVPTYVLGVNEDPATGLPDAQVISNASCTTNSIAPVAAVILAKFGIAKATMTTIHAYTDDQNLQDSSHKDLRRARAAAVNIVPTTTGASIAATETLPALKSLFGGTALRVPVITGSLTNFVFLTKRQVTVEEVNQAFKEAVKKPIFQGILAVTEDPIVSSDIIGSDYSAIIDLPLTQVVDGDLVSVFAWYDNEWGYTNRLVEQAIRVGKALTNHAPSDPLTMHFLETPHDVLLQP
jgi:glyceraldehyde 3-phosphate dehydrogenase